MPFQLDSSSESHVALNDGVGFLQNRAFAAIARSVEIGHIIGRGLQSGLLGLQPTQRNRNRAK